MKNRLPFLLALVFLCGSFHISTAQNARGKATTSYDTIRIAAYNLLNYPGSINRHATYRTVISTMKPDVLAVEEVTYGGSQTTGQTNIDHLRDSVMNYSTPAVYSSAPFQHGGSSDDTETGLFFKTSKVTYLSESTIPTDLRNVSEYVIRVNSTGDTLRLYVVHLKASSDTASENRRLIECTDLRNYLNTLPPNAKFLIMGDFNTYASTDLGLQKLVESEADNDGRSKDPLNSVGAWHNDFNFRFIHTQSPRVRAFGGGSTGGMDDRFDLILTSMSSLDNNVIVSHYTPYGNDGNHFNDSINRLPNAAVPDSVANALHYSSDHLPVYCDFQFAVASALTSFAQTSPSNGAGGVMPSGTLTWRTCGNATSYNVYLDTNNPPTTLVAAGVTDTTYSYSGLKLEKTYRWKIVAKNATDSLVASNAPTNFTTVSGPAQPTNVTATYIALDSIQISWTDNATDETGYRVYRSTSFFGPFTQDGGDLPANTISFTDTGLTINQRYYYFITPFNGLGEGNSGAVSAATLAVVPGIPALTNLEFLSITVTIDSSGNPTPTQFAIQCAHDSVTQYVQANGSLGTPPIWHTFSEWGGSGGTPVSVQHSCMQYTFRVKARNDDNVETAFGSDSSQTTPCFSIADSLRKGWNLLSLPLTVTNGRKSVIFPASSSDLYTYHNGYVVRDSLVNGAGYWLKFDNAQEINLPGDPRFADSMSVNKGWNMVGSSSSSVDVTTITSNPDSLVLTPFYDYNSTGYHTSGTVDPLKGYWVKVRGSGKLFLPASPLAAPRTAVKKTVTEFDKTGLNLFTFEDNVGHQQTIYVGKGDESIQSTSMFELPPVPPAGLFDVRFGTQQYVEFVSSKSQEIPEFPVSFQSSSYPVKVTWRLNGNDGLSFQWKLNGAVRSTNQIYLQKSDRLSLTVGQPNGSLQPKEFALHQNYPNPFNPLTEIRYDLPTESIVRLTVFNVLGTQVATLVDGRQASGSHGIEWRPALASGVYFYRLQATSTENPGKSFQQIKRMLLLK